MVNRPATQTPERRQRPRPKAAHAAALSGGTGGHNPFGDLHTLQHLSARFARSLRGVFESLLRQDVRAWAEPLVVQRFADYRGERPEKLTAWVPLRMAPGGSPALLVMDGRFVLRLLDLFFGGAGTLPAELPAEFSPAAEALAARVATALARPLAAAWEPVTPLSFTPGKLESTHSLAADLDADDAVVATRFGIAAGDGKPDLIDLLYPLASLKPHAPSLTAKVARAAAAPDPAWRGALTRAAMSVRFPVRSVLAEAEVPLATLMNLKVGDVIPICFGTQVPVMVGADALATGTVGVSNGHAAVKLDRMTRPLEDL